MPSVQTASPSRRKIHDQGNISALADQLRAAMRKVDELPPQMTADRDNKAMTQAMTPVNTLFDKIKRCSPKSVADVSLQMTTIADVAEWFGSPADVAMEDISPAEFRAIAKGLKTLLEAGRPCSNPSPIIAREPAATPAELIAYEAMEGPISELVTQAGLAMTVFANETLFLRSVEQLERMLLRFSENYYAKDFRADI